MITNLAKVRTFLYHRGFHLVLHGHKHNAYAAWDWLVPPRDDLDEVPHRALVLGAQASFKIDTPGLQTDRGLSRPEQSRWQERPRVRVITIKGVEAWRAGDAELRQSPCVHWLSQPLAASDEETPWVFKAQDCRCGLSATTRSAAGRWRQRAVNQRRGETRSRRYGCRATTETGKMYTRGGDGGLVAAARAGGDQLLLRLGVRPRRTTVSATETQLSRAVETMPSSKAIALLVRPEEAGDREQRVPRVYRGAVASRKRARASTSSMSSASTASRISTSGGR